MFRIYGTCSVLLLVGHTLNRTYYTDGWYGAIFVENSLDLHYYHGAGLLVNS